MKGNITMSKKTGKDSGTAHPGANMKTCLTLLVVLVLGVLALYWGSGIELSPNKVKISPAPPKNPASGAVKIEQTASASGENASATNVGGSVNKAKKPVDASPAAAAEKLASRELHQEASASGKNSSAKNVGGDLNAE